MSVSSCRCFASLLLTVPLTVYALPADTAISRQAQASSTVSLSPTAPQTASPAKTYDQIVRLSLVEGDVRLARGKDAEHATGGDWGQATADTPIEEGFTLVTGKGRAEIEFEDASTVYLGENSVMTFNQLTATGGVPQTDVTLVSGTATLNITPEFAGELFLVRASIGRIAIRYPDVNFVRVNSYLDAMAVTPQENGTIRFGTSLRKIIAGQTTIYKRDGQIVPGGPESQSEFAEWDKWAAARVTARRQAMSAAMKDAGLISPIPGLAEMKDQGTFFECAPYGTCWQPVNGWERDSAAASSPQQPAQADPHTVSVQELQSAGPNAVSAKALQSGSPNAILRTEYDDEFPCSPNQIRRLIARDPLTGRDTILRTYVGPNTSPYSWAVCHSGSWIQREHRYVWVAGTKRHHHCPVRWVTYGGKKGFVPIHPHDVAGKAPLNLKHGVFETGRKGESVKQVAFNSTTSVKVLDGAPKEFLRPYYPQLQHAETPRLEAHLVKDGFGSVKEGLAKPAGTPITFDHRSQSIMLARQETVGGKSTMVTEHFGGAHDGGSGMRASGGSWSGGSSGRSGSGGWSSGGSHGGSGGAGGGSHGGGGGGGFSGGGGGGSHGGGGGGGGASSGGGGSAGGGSHK
jgi:FecR protein